MQPQSSLKDYERNEAVHNFKPIDQYEIPPSEVQADYVEHNRFLNNWMDNEFQARWGTLFALADETQRRLICEAHARACDMAMEAQFGEAVRVQVVPIDEPDGWRVIYQLEKHADYYPENFVVQYTESSGIVVDTDGDGK